MPFESLSARGEIEIPDFPSEWLPLTSLYDPDLPLLPDLQGSLTGPLAPANQVVEELWHQVIAPAFGNALPFGKCWDGVFGLVRFIASWNSDGGRKGELIQTHYFAAAFGVRIATGNT